MSSTEINRQYYESLASGREDYWRLMAAPRRRMEVILDLLHELHPRSAVDLGCGDGTLLAEVKKHWPEMMLAGVDLSENQIAANRARDGAVEWIAADLQAPLEAQRRFDVAIASEIIEHLDAPPMLLRNARALASTLIVTTQSGPIRETERRVGHRQHFAAEALGALLEETGWRARRIWNEGFPFHDLSKWAANLNAGASMHYFGERGYGPAQRFVSWGLRVAFRLNSRRRGAQLFAVAEAA